MPSGGRPLSLSASSMACECLCVHMCVCVTAPHQSENLICSFKSILPASHPSLSPPPTSLHSLHSIIYLLLSPDDSAACCFLICTHSFSFHPACLFLSLYVSLSNNILFLLSLFPSSVAPLPPRLSRSTVQLPKCRG